MRFELEDEALHDGVDAELGLLRRFDGGAGAWDGGARGWNG